MKLFFPPATLTRFGIFLLLLAVSAASAGILTGSTGSHDPSRMINCSGTYYIYSTGGGMMHSTDRLNWSSGTSPFSSFPGSRPPSMKAFIPYDEGIWAPDVIFYNDQYYLYYAISSTNTGSANVCAIGLITSPTLNTSASNYKWTDQGVVVSTPANVPNTDTGAIDPCPFMDASNNLWLSFGSGYTQNASTPTIFLSRLDNITGLRSSADTNFYAIEPGHIEASYNYYHNGYYYAFWNSGGCCSGSNSTYTIHMARSPTITGPYVDKNGNANSSSTFLSSTVVKNSVNGNEHGPGQIGILSEGGIDRCTYHYYPDTGGSVVGEETILWGADGWPSCGTDLAPGTYKVSSLNNGLVMGVYQAGTANGTALDQETYTGSSYQQWAVAYTTNGSAADGYYSLTSAGSGQVVDLYQSKTSNGTLIDQWPWNNANNQRWFVEQTSEGYYRMVSKVSQSVIDVTNLSDASGTWLEEMVWSNTVNQQWIFGTTSGTPPATPPGLKAAAGSGQVLLSWNAVSGAIQYDLKRGMTSGGPYPASLGTATAATFTDNAVTNHWTYYYVVSAVNASGVSGKSLPASATPGGLLPAPIIGGSSFSGGNFILTGTGGLAGATYYVLASTNLAVSTTNWTRLLTNQFDDSGNFNFTNAIPPDAPQNFYLLQLP